MIMSSEKKYPNDLIFIGKVGNEVNPIIHHGSDGDYFHSGTGKDIWFNRNMIEEMPDHFKPVEPEKEKRYVLSAEDIYNWHHVWSGLSAPCYIEENLIAQGFKPLPDTSIPQDRQQAIFDAFSAAGFTAIQGEMDDFEDGLNVGGYMIVPLDETLPETGEGLINE